MSFCSSCLSILRKIREYQKKISYYTSEIIEKREEINKMNVSPWITVPTPTPHNFILIFFSFLNNLQHITREFFFNSLFLSEKTKKKNTEETTSSRSKAASLWSPSANYSSFLIQLVSSHIIVEEHRILTWGIHSDNSNSFQCELAREFKTWIQRT